MSREILFVGTYPPTRCGLATFCQSLLHAVARSRGSSLGLSVLAVGSHPGPFHRAEVGRIDVDGPTAVYGRMAIPSRLNHPDTMVILQHEFGIYGPDDGLGVLDLVESAEGPVVVVMHTVLVKPTQRQRYIVEELARSAMALVVMSDSARQRLEDGYNLHGCPVEMIPHGAIAGQPIAVSPDDRPVLLTWGLLGPGKGLELVIESLSQLRHLDPLPVYVIAGQTHPNVRRSQGESYRDGLRRLADKRGVADMVHFVDEYLTPADLTQLRSKARLVVLPYESHEQVTSGALVEALAAAVPVVATRFPHAVELLEGGAGRLVDHGDVDAMAGAITSMLSDRLVRAEAHRAIARVRPSLSWDSVALRYERLVAREAVEVGAA